MKLELEMIPQLDLSNQAVIDAHCHPFSETTNYLTTSQLLSLLSIGGPQYSLTIDSNSQLFHPQNLLLYRIFLKKLAHFLDCSPKLEDVLAARNQKSEAFKSYLDELFADARLQLLLMEDGYTEVTTTHPIPRVNFEELERFIPLPIARIKRIEPLIQVTLDESENFEDFINTYTLALDMAVKNQNGVAFKSIMAYRTGLSIQVRDETDAKEEYHWYKENGKRAWFGPGVKKLREYLVYLSIKKSAELNIPFQIHTGIGDTDIILDRCNPIYLFNLLKEEELHQTTIILVHSGYPYTAEAAYLTNAFPNVYMDLSLMFPFAYTGAATRLLEILELAPVSKIIYGSDGFSIPELHWLSCKLSKEVLGRVLAQLVAQEALDEEEAYDSASMIFVENAQRVYRLG